MLKITPNPNCKYCHGKGVVYDSVDYGSTTVSMESYCDCVLEQVDCEDFEIAPIICPICKGQGDVIPFLDDGLDITCKTCKGNGSVSKEQLDNVYEKYADLWEDE